MGENKIEKNEKFNQHLERIFQIMEISYLDVLPVAKSNPWRNNLYSEKDDHSQRKTISLRTRVWLIVCCHGYYREAEIKIFYILRLFYMKISSSTSK